jgi:hypothetical protein
MYVQQLNQLQATEAFGKSFKPMLKNMQNYSSVYMSLCFGQQTGRNKILHRMAVELP